MEPESKSNQQMNCFLIHSSPLLLLISRKNRNSWFQILRNRHSSKLQSDYKSGLARFFRAHSSTSSLPLSAKDGDRLDEEKARLDNVDKTEKGENNAATTVTPAATTGGPPEKTPQKTPEKKAEVVKEKPEPDTKSNEDKKSNKSNGAHTPV